jgi:hypothetical protein
MKILKENGMLDLDIIEEIIWHLRMSDIDLLRQPVDKDGKYQVHPMVWRGNKANVKTLKQYLTYIRDTAQNQEHIYSRLDKNRNDINELQNQINKLTKEKECVEIENTNLKDKIQEAQITAGLFIQSVKDKLPSWFIKDKEE